MSEEFNNYEEQNQEETQNNYYDYSQVTPEPQPVVTKVNSNLVPGLVGAFLGSIIGAILWFVIYQIGFIAGIAGAVTIVCALKGYEMFGKGLDKKGVICCVLIAIITIYLANRFCWAWEIYTLFTEEGYQLNLLDVFAGTEDFLAEFEIMGDYIKDLLIGYGLTVVAGYKDIISAFKSA